MADPTERTFPMPAHQRVLVKLIERDDALEQPIRGVSSGIPDEGIVTHVGPGYRLMSGDYAPMDYREGDKVMFYRDYAVPIPFEVMGEIEMLLLVRDENVLVVMEGGLDPLDDMIESDEARERSSG